MDLQLAFNLTTGIIAFLGGYVLNSISKRIESLQAADTALTEKVHKIETLVIGEYVKHSELDRLGEALFKKLDKIDIKLDNKQDKL